MDRRTFLLGLLGASTVTPTIIAAASSVEAAPLPPSPEPLPEPVSASSVTEADLEGVKADWAQVDVPGPARRRVRRGARRVRRTMRRGARRANRTARRTGRVMRR